MLNNTKYYTLLFICFVTISSNLYAQNNFYFTEPSTVSLPCSTNCITLHSNYQKKLATTNYNYTSIPFATSSLVAPTVLSLGDDNFSNPIPIGFDFCFYNQLYDTIYISSNGVLTFNANYANNACSFNVQAGLPFYNATYADNAIFGPFMDLKPSVGGSIQYKMLGTAPNRTFVVQYNNVKLFGASCSNTTSTFEIVLHELTNYIDFQITNKAVCDSDPLNYLNYATQGVQSAAANLYTHVSGRNASVWASINEGFRFLPAGANNYTLEWLQNNIVINTGADSLAICGGPYPKQIVAKITYTCPNIVLTDTVTIVQQAGLLDSVNITRPTCKYSTNGSITAFASSINAPYTFSLNYLPYTSNNIFTGLDTGFYSLRIKDVTGCAKDTLIELVALSYLTIEEDSIAYASCDSSIDGYASVIANYGVMPYTYFWNNGSTFTYIPNVAGNSVYNCTATDAVGCTASITVFVPEHQLTVVLDSVKNSVCPQNNGYLEIIASDGTAPYNYAWTNGATGPILDSIAPGNYNVTVTDSLGCFKTTTFIIGIDSLPILSATVTDNICEFMNGTVTTNVIGGTPPYTYLWNTGANTPNLSGLDSGGYILTVTDFKGCVNNAIFNLKDTFRLKTIHTTLHTSCGLNNGTGAIIAFSGLLPYNYTWSNGTTGMQTTNLAPGLNVCTTVDANGCTQYDTLYILPSQALQASTAIANAHCDSANGSINVTPNNGVPPYTYSWNSGQNTASVYNLAPNQFYIYTLTDSKNCIFKDTIFIADDGKPYLNVTNYTAPLCFGDSTGIIELQGYLGVSPYKYSVDGVNFETNALLTNIAGGNYIIYVKDANSCIYDTTVFLPQPTLMVNNFNKPDTLVCYNSVANPVSIITSGAYPPYKYALNSGLYQTNNTFNNLNIGSYTVSVSDSVGCIQKLPFNVIGPSSGLQVQFAKIDVPCFQKNTGQLTANAFGGWPPYNYLWSTGNTTPSLDSAKAGTYQLKITDAKGCLLETAIELKQLECCICNVPSGFTPNADLLNDELKLITNSKIVELQFAIYNRLGQKVFETSNVNQTWDGKLREKEMATETYYYYLRYKCATEDNFIIKKGDITLIR